MMQFIQSMDFEKFIICYGVLLMLIMMWLCVCIGENRELRKENNHMRRLLKRGEKEHEIF